MLASHVTVFLATGVLTATWAARLPDTAQRLDLSIADVALVVLGIEGGALAGLPAGAALVALLGCRRGLRLGFALYAGGVPVLAIAPSLGVLVLAAAGWAAANSVVDVAMNTAGVRLESRAHRPVLATLHAGQSAGVLLGAAVATAAATAGVPLPVHFAAVGTVAALAALPAAVAAPTAAGAAPRLLARPDRRLVLIGAVAFCGFLVEGAAAAWAGIHLRTEHGASAGLAAAGYTATVAALAVVRLFGDRIAARVGRVRVVRTSGLVAAAGTALVTLAPSVPAAVAGWAVLGAGIALVAPTVIGAAPEAANPASAIAAVTVVGYAGSFSGPPAVGAIAAASSLSAAIGLCAVAGLALAALARRAL
ncbi:hypothetical protein K1T35_08115 [Pseudonocardia sp. DSM 110487]|uniref:MFS transporter n=1 Tax=Pseudonocardia sp. DSM 110487 TaxID=2865833 RepID=UPI001C698567|nr:MFS transporter [Pseudonocardia sp. DSM 110487]QYN37197.1 hypothetical protein K1T35_08115 [Pseudonocardia sp. DSM 110487]